MVVFSVHFCVLWVNTLPVKIDSFFDQNTIQYDYSLNDSVTK